MTDYPSAAEYENLARSLASDKARGVIYADYWHINVSANRGIGGPSASEIVRRMQPYPDLELRWFGTNDIRAKAYRRRPSRGWRKHVRRTKAVQHRSSH